jgi:hypothetical protein
VPNPFAGMDPYLEGDLWMTVHTDLCVEIARQLSPKLRPKYIALSTRRVVLAEPDDSELSGSHRFPDVGIVSSHGPDGTGAIGRRPVEFTTIGTRGLCDLEVGGRRRVKVKFFIVDGPLKKRGTGSTNSSLQSTLGWHPTRQSRLNEFTSRPTGLAWITQ